MASSGGDGATAGGEASAPNPSSNSSRPRGGGGRGGGPSGGDGPRGRGRNRRGGGGGGGRGRGDGQARGGGQRGRGRGNSEAKPEAAAPVGGDGAPSGLSAVHGISNPAETRAKPEGADDESDDADSDVCFICANPITHYSVAPCNHITCHICALRMRALYKNKDCPHCRTLAPYVIFTDEPSKRYEEYSPADFSSTDDNIGIRYTKEDIVGDTVLLLRYNCPNPTCDFAGLGWPDLHRHVRSVHHNKMCDLCTRNKKVFTHEHELFTDKGLEKHMRHGDDRPGALDQTGFKGHPLCSFCGERFYDDDKLYEHCRNKHERCFICDRQDSRHPHYYLDYNALEDHFKKDHFLCLDRECLEKKFVVFGSEMDLKAHQLSEHANSLSKDVRRDARVVDLSGFDYRQTYEQERGSGGGGRRDGNRRGRGRDPNAEALPVSSAQPMRRDELAFQRQLAIHSAQSVTPRTFGGQLTSNASSSAATPSSRQGGSSTPAAAQQQVQPLADSLATMSVAEASNLPSQERARQVRHGAVIERATNLLGNDATKLGTFRSDISAFRQGSLTAPQLIDAFFALFSETSSHALGTLVREVSDLFDDKAKADALRKAWQDWRAINEDYPSLPGLGGMHGATTSSSGWASAAAASPSTQATIGSAQAQKHTTRVLKLKSSTRRGSAGGVPGPSPSQNAGVPGSAAWVAQAAASRAPPSAAFPALPSSGGSSSRSSQPMWIGGSGVASSNVIPRSVPASGTSMPRRGGAGALSKPNEDAFPALPTAAKPAMSIFGYGTGAVRRDMASNRGTGFSWGGADSAGGGGGSSAVGEEDGDGDTTGKGKKKGKQGKKQVLVQWG